MKMDVICMLLGCDAQAHQRLLVSPGRSYNDGRLHTSSWSGTSAAATVIGHQSVFIEQSLSSNRLLDSPFPPAGQAGSVARSVEGLQNTPGRPT
ncbi:hypothetical protein WJX84_006917 [Apatococcus fuscideae]|uniref:Uncharacterized protein n=1 Tax=Apatococcus fuscideae TaxID=2026836 RepID=A0AAW1T6R0_9CHLO